MVLMEVWRLHIALLRSNWHCLGRFGHTISVVPSPVVQAVEALLFGSIEREELLRLIPFWNCTGFRAMEFSFFISELHGDILY